MSALWYLAPSLAVLRGEVDARWPGRDRTSDGTVGDLAHQQRESDHNPNLRSSVNAWDVDRDGVDVVEILAAFQRHPSAHYWIWNRQIADRDAGWVRRAYTGDNPHTAHAHLSIRQTREAEQDTRPWGLLEEDDVPLTNADVAKIWSAQFGATGNRVTASQLLAEARRDAALALAGVSALRGVIEALAAALAAGGGDVDVHAILTGVDERLATARADLRDAVADLGEGGAAQVRGAQ